VEDITHKEKAGFQVIGTTSWGIANSQG